MIISFAELTMNFNDSSFSQHFNEMKQRAKYCYPQSKIHDANCYPLDKVDDVKNLN